MLYIQMMWVTTRELVFDSFVTFVSILFLFTLQFSLGIILSLFYLLPSGVSVRKVLIFCLVIAD